MGRRHCTRGAPDESYCSLEIHGNTRHFVGNVLKEPWPFDRPPYLGSTLTRCVNLVGQTALPTTWDTGEAYRNRSSSARYSFRMTTYRNRSTPLGNDFPVPDNTEAAQACAPWDRERSKRIDVLCVGVYPVVITVDPGGRSGRLSAYAWKSSRLLLGAHRSESNRKRSSASKGTREPQSSMAITRTGQVATVEFSPMRRLGVGASIVVRGREGRPHGEGRQEDSVWTTERFNNRKGFR